MMNLIYATDVDDNNLVIEEERKHRAGDKITLQFKEGITKEYEMEEFLQYYTTSVEPLMSYESRTTYNSGFEQMIGMITTVGTTLAGLIGLIGVLDFINTILTGIFTRQREFAMMEAIGILFSLTVLKSIGGGLWFMNYRFELLPMLIACPILLILGMSVPKIVYALRGERSIVEEIRE